MNLRSLTARFGNVHDKLKEIKIKGKPYYNNLKFEKDNVVGYPDVFFIIKHGILKLLYTTMKGQFAN